jgi:hypothetical protein
MFFGE